MFVDIIVEILYKVFIL